MLQVIYGVEHRALGKSQCVRSVNSEQEAIQEAEQLNRELTADLRECNSFHAVKYTYDFFDSLDDRLLCNFDVEEL